MNHSKLSRIVLAAVLTVGVVILAHSKGMANETQDLRNQVQVLQQKVNQLEQQLAKSSSQDNLNKSMARHPQAIFYDDWNPWVQMELMRRHMGQFMEENGVDFNPREDIKETPQAYIITMDIPGMEKDKINIEVKRGMLIISGERSSESKEDKAHQYYRQERSFGHFVRSLSLPEDAKTDNINAEYNNGVLTVKIPRSESNGVAAAGQKIKIK